MKHPTSSCLKKDILKGYVFCLKNQGSSPSDAYSNLIQFTRTEVLNQKEVEEVFEKDKFDSYHNLTLAHDGICFDEKIQSFLGYAKTNRFHPLQGELKKIIGTEVYSEQFFVQGHRWGNEHKKKYNKDQMLGFLLCLKVQSLNKKDQKKVAQEAYERLKEVTGGEEHLSMEEVNEFYERIHRGEFIEQNHEQRLWDVMKVPHVMDRIVDFADIQSRRMLAQTSREFNRLTNTRPFHIENLTIIFEYEHKRVEADSEVLKSTRLFSRMGGNGRGEARMEQNGGDIWYDTELFNRPFVRRKTIQWFLNRPNLTVKNLKIRLRSEQNHLAENALLKVENLYTNSHVPLKWIFPGSLQKIVHSGDRFLLSPPKMDKFVSSGVISYSRRRKFMRFKFAMFTIRDRLNYDKVMKIKKDILQKCPDLREYKININLSDADFNQINMQMGTFNSRHSQNPNWERIEHPSGKYLLMTVVEHYIWFRGPGYIPGEMQKAEEELLERRYRLERRIEFRRDGTMKEDASGSETPSTITSPSETEDEENFFSSDSDSDDFNY
uniref:F-box domain-containing protein n=1 Tax=Caenorhabditis tropicalis TaxID=1561998 RepID=A0A1I7UYP1_9PELO